MHEMKMEIKELRKFKGFVINSSTDMDDETESVGLIK